MALMVVEVYDALQEAGASAVKARKAAEAMVQDENRLAKIEAAPRVLQWMVGFNLAATMAVLFKMVLQ
jgi:hypothetical protein